MLLIACINLANAQLARIMARDREAALRTALGASAWALVQASLVESLLLAAAGGSLGIALAGFAVHRFSSFVHIAIPRAANITLSPTVLVLSVACTVAATVLFGALPALRYLRAQPQAALAGTNRAAGSSSGSALRRWLITGQVLACTALLLLTTLFARNLLQLLHTSDGLHTGGTVVASMRLQGTGPAYEKQFIAFDDGALDRLRNLPGVTSAAMVSSLLSQGQIWLDSVTSTSGGDTSGVLAQYRWVSPDYFTTVGQRILAGRALDARDRTLNNAVITQATATAVWPHLNALGRTFQRRRHNLSPSSASPRTSAATLREKPPSAWCTCRSGKIRPPAPSSSSTAPATPPRSHPSSARPSGATTPPPPSRVSSTLDDQLADTLAPERLQTDLLAGFGAAALLLALLGIYSTLNYSIGRRLQEFGIRMALGATRANIYRITFQQVAIPIAAGIVGGWLLSLAVARTVRSLLQDAPTASPLLTAGILAALILAAALAAYFPCRRASRLEPMDALRSE